jgi:hypothetical protein
MPFSEFHEPDLQLISEASKALNKYLDAVERNSSYETKVKRWICLREALFNIGKISPELKETFMKSHNLWQDKNLLQDHNLLNAVEHAVSR